jgi:hypothetical protein
MRPDTGCADALWSLGRVTSTPSRLPQARPASPGGPQGADLARCAPPDRLPARAGPPRGHRQTDHSPSRSPPAAWRGSASCREFPSPYRRWRTPARDHTGAHEPLPTSGTPLRMGVPPLRTHRLPVQRCWRLQRRLAQRRTTDGQGRRVAGMVQPIRPHDPRLGHRHMQQPALEKVGHG